MGWISSYETFAQKFIVHDLDPKFIALIHLGESDRILLGPKRAGNRYKKASEGIMFYGLVNVFRLCSFLSRTKFVFQFLWLMGGDRGNVQVLKMRQLDRNESPGYQEPLVEVLLQSLSYHKADENLVGYCAHNNRLFLLYNLTPLRSHLLSKLLAWGWS